MLDGRGQVLLTDFGLAGFADQIEGAEIRNGTPAYMSPEQLDGKEVTVRRAIFTRWVWCFTKFSPASARSIPIRLPAWNARARKKRLTNPSTLVKDLDPLR